MQIPFPSFSVDPAKRSVRQAGDEVIALGVVAVPPSRFDPFRADERRESADVDFFRLEKPQRPRTRGRRFARVPFAGLDAAPGVFGPVLGLGSETEYRLVAQARAQPLEEARPVLAVAASVAEHGGARAGER